MFSWIAESRRAAVLLTAGAIAERIGWTMAGHMAMLDTELRNAAMHWATTGAIADAMRPGSGPTAHVGALPVLIPGAVMRALGPDTAATTLALTALSALVIVATALVLNGVFQRLGTPAAARGLALLIICLVPLHVEIEARSLRVYENGTAALLLALLLLGVVRLDRGRAIRFTDLLGLSALAALLVALSPALAPCAAAMLGVLAMRRLDWRGRATAVIVLGVAIFMTTLPWAMRNHDILGETVLTRSNFGLELAVGTHAAAVDPVDPGATYLARLAKVHPHGSETGYRAMVQAGGELPYARKLGAEAWRWVAAHPVDALHIWVRHLREFYFPPAWMWMHSGRPDATTPVRLILADLIAVVALVGLAGALLQRRQGFLYVVPAVVLIPLPYILTQPLVRYRYVIASLLIFLAVDAVVRLTGRGQSALKIGP